MAFKSQVKCVYRIPALFFYREGKTLLVFAKQWKNRKTEGGILQCVDDSGNQLQELFHHWSTCEYISLILTKSKPLCCIYTPLNMFSGHSSDQWKRLIEMDTVLLTSAQFRAARHLPVFHLCLRQIQNLNNKPCLCNITSEDPGQTCRDVTYLNWNWLCYICSWCSMLPAPAYAPGRTLLHICTLPIQ